MLTLGVSALEHDPAAAMLHDGVIETAIEERKLLRFPVHGVPHAAIRDCFAQTGTDWRKVDQVAFAGQPFRGWLRRSLAVARSFRSASPTDAYYRAKELNTWRSMSETKELAGANFVNFEHHLCHAAAAFYSSPFDNALILTLDEEGDGCSGLLAVGNGTKIRTLRRIRFPHSLGWFYSQMTVLLGFVPRQEEHKVQWLSLEGEPVFGDIFLDILKRPANPLPNLNFSYFNRGLAGPLALSGKFYARIGLPPPSGPEVGLSPDHKRAVASSLQYACAKLVGDLMEHYCKAEGIEDACLGGGLFENTVLVADLEKKFGHHIFVPPAPGNAGCAIGAAELVQHQVLNQPRTAPISNVYWGPKYSRQQIKDVLDNCKAKYSCHYTELEKIDAAVQLLEAGKIVAWYQGATEFGPRALGNRSLMASPWAAYVKENLNDYVKHREWFRPFALAVPEEDCQRFFECSLLPRLMTSLAWALPTPDQALQAFFLPGNRVRLHVVEQRSNPLFWRLLKRFGERAPAPILINTSFNLFGEPLVVSPRDAVRTFYCSGIDALMLDNFFLKKHNSAGETVPLAPFQDGG